MHTECYLPCRFFFILDSLYIDHLIILILVGVISLAYWFMARRLIPIDENPPSPQTGA